MTGENKPFQANERCLTCSKELIGKLGKKFCNDLCRANYHNLKSPANKPSIKAINKILLKNRKALKEIAAGDRTKLKKDMLVKKGFNFDFSTQIKEVNNSTYTFCYEWGYRIVAIDEVEIVKLDENSFLASK